jgi:Ni/Co efflux regulator RcnB
MRRFVIALILAAIAISPIAGRSIGSGRSIPRSEARTRRGVARSEARNSSTTHTRRGHAAGGWASAASTRCTICERDANGRIKRNPAARRAFQRGNPCPATGRTSGACPGYVVDHIVPLKRGGADEPGNMQWQTVADAKAKDRIE